MTKRLARPGLTRLSGIAALIGLALGGCSSIMNLPGSVVDDSASAASPANLASLTDVLSKNPNDPQAYNMRGSVLGQSGRYQEAITDFDKAIALDATYAQAYANRALANRQLGQVDLALADYDRALDIDAAYAVAYVGRGMVRRDKGQLLEALQDFNKAIQIRPDNAQAYYNRGLLYQSQKQHQYAIDDLTTAIGLSQQQAEPFVARAFEPSRGRRRQGGGRRSRRPAVEDRAR
ncbi:MAG: tetratricopeptide repeat protein, partial [Anaerolineales bacterium]|nr:tetratricopeptide repeat protein [Anaerolineales bacterium]